jgi:hypothetical protein
MPAQELGQHAEFGASGGTLAPGERDAAAGAA